MTDRPATETIIDNARREAGEIANEYGWGQSYPVATLKAYLTDMEANNQTPQEYARNRGWIK